ncbi:hypothetical protein Tco_0303861 [Tanacetum coccineum]
MSFLRDLVILGISSMMLLSIRCINLGELLQLLINRSYLGKASGLEKAFLLELKCCTLQEFLKFKKASPTKKDSVLVPVDEEPVTKGKQIKRSVKKSSTKPTTGIVIREPSVETKSKGKEKKKKSWGNDEDENNIRTRGRLRNGCYSDQFDDDRTTQISRATQTGKEVVQGEGDDAEMIDAQQGNENLETTQEQVVEDAHVTISTICYKED